jgi:aminoglycoside phosphotransferase
VSSADGSALDLLTGPDAGDLLTTAVATRGGRLDRWRVSQVDHRPGDVTTVAYLARVNWPDGDRDDVLGASMRTIPTGPAEPAESVDLHSNLPGVLTLSDGERQVSVWCVPNDPELPGLAAALDPGSLTRLLRSFTVDPTGLRTRLIAYRPQRRAVIQVTARGGTWFIKVLRKGGAEALHYRHRLLHRAGLPVPHSLGWSDDGLLVLEGLPGTGLRSLLTRPPGTMLPTAGELIAVLDLLPAEVATLPRRQPWSLASDQYAQVIAAALPPERDRVRQLAQAVSAGLADADPGTEATHGDFYEAQLLVGKGRISGLLDVDTAGPGCRTDDLACALAHLEALAVSDPASAEAATALAADWRAGFEATVDPVELRLRTAGVLIALATGPHRVQRPGWQAATTRALDNIERRLR